MNLQTQPDAATCYATSVAMLLNIDIQILLQELPNAKQVLHPGRPGSLKYRGHHPQDFTIPLLKRGYCLTMMYAKIPISHLYMGKKCLWCGGSGKFKGKWETYPIEDLLDRPGILQYGAHFVAWDGRDIYDPAGTVRSFEPNPLGFQIWHKIQSGAEN